MSLSNYKELHVWKKSFDLALRVYTITNHFPKYEIYGLTSQIRRASVSISSNIAEGYSRNYVKEYLQHLSIAHGSLSELETQLLLAKALNYIEEKDAESLFDEVSEVGRMLNGLKNSLKTKIAS